MSTSYKPALLKALVRIVGREGPKNVPLLAIGAEFVRLYWNQTVVFHLRQAAVISKEPEVIRAIRAAAEVSGIRDLEKLPKAERLALDRKMARILTIDVLNAFHASKPAGMPPLFSWVKGQTSISIGDSAFEFLRAQDRALELLANYWWAAYLQRVNIMAPAIIEKVERDGARRASLGKFLRILRQSDEQRCFYCERVFSQGVRVEVDHVLPWSFLLADPVWDLVLSCSFCNAAKSDRLPAREFIDKLVATNVARRRHNILVDTVSPLVNDEGLVRLYEAAISVEWPGPWHPA